MKPWSVQLTLAIFAALPHFYLAQIHAKELQRNPEFMEILGLAQKELKTEKSILSAFTVPKKMQLISTVCPAQKDSMIQNASGTETILTDTILQKFTLVMATKDTDGNITLSFRPAGTPFVHQHIFEFKRTSSDSSTCYEFPYTYRSGFTYIIVCRQSGRKLLLLRIEKAESC